MRMEETLELIVVVGEEAVVDDFAGEKERFFKSGGAPTFKCGTGIPVICIQRSENFT